MVMWLGLIAIVALAASTDAASIEQRQLLAAPTVQIKNGTIIGSSDLLAQVDSFNGIPYALQPTGVRRLTNPTSLTSTFGTFTATGTPLACPGYLQSRPTASGAQAAIDTALATNSISKQTATTGEACLNLNVQRTTGVKAGQKVPVLAYIYGGGFEYGSTSMYEGSPFIKKAQSLGLPLVYVAISYRLAALGFLPGKEMAGNSNLGLKDQRLALRWVSENIAAFGGDPGRVTIWGESAGSISVFDHLIAEGGNIDHNGTPLFVGAIMNSGSVVPALPISAPVNQAIYDQVVLAAGCNGTSDTLACLRSVPADTIIAAQATLPDLSSYQSLHLPYFPRPDPSDDFYPDSPEDLVASAAYARVPIIIGDQEDEGTQFALSQQNLTTSDQLIDYFTTWTPEGNRADMATLVNSYPDDPAEGSPFRTGVANSYYPQYKRIAAIAGDVVFTLARRVYLSLAVANGITAYSYLNTYMHNMFPIGTWHGSDIINDRTMPLSYTAQNATQIYYLSFTYYQDPNRITPSVVWPTWDNTDRKLLNFTQDQILIGDDYFREQQYQTLLSLSGKLRA